MLAQLCEHQHESRRRDVMLQSMHVCWVFGFNAKLQEEVCQSSLQSCGRAILRRGRSFSMRLGKKQSPGSPFLVGDTAVTCLYLRAWRQKCNSAVCLGKKQSSWSPCLVGGTAVPECTLNDRKRTVIPLWAQCISRAAMCEAPFPSIVFC